MTAFWLRPDWSGTEPFWMREPLAQIRGEQDDLDLIRELWAEEHRGKAEILRKHLRGRGYLVYDERVLSPLTETRHS